MKKRRFAAKKLAEVFSIWQRIHQTVCLFDIHVVLFTISSFLTACYLNCPITKSRCSTSYPQIIPTPPKAALAFSFPMPLIALPISYIFLMSQDISCFFQRYSL